MNNSKKRVVVTGLGVVSSIGIGVEEFWKNLIAGKSGISEITAFDTSPYPVHKGGEVKNFRPQDFISRRRIKNLGRASQMAIAATRLALEDAGITRELKRFGVFVGTTMGEIQALENVSSDWIKRGHHPIAKGSIFLFPANIITINIAREFKMSGYNFMFPTACASGNYAIGYAYDLIKSGQLRLAVAGGSDALSRIAFTGFNRLYAMAPDKCQPFDKNRKGMMLGEGAGVLVLESVEHAQQRGAKIYAEVLGYGLSCDARHMTHPSINGIAKCMEKALKDAGVAKDEVDYISAHGTGTPENDKAECAAMKKVFGRRAATIPCSSIKSMLGHTMGAASAIAAIACCLAIRNNIIPPTIKYETPDEKCAIDCVPNKSRNHAARVVLNNSQAFGDNNACLMLRKFK